LNVVVVSAVASRLPNMELASVLNIPSYVNSPPEQLIPVIIGELYTTRKRSKEWKKRYVRIIGRRLEIYIEDTEVLRRMFDLYNCAAALLPKTSNGESGFYYPFRLCSANTFGVELEMATTTNEDRLAWLKLIGAQSRLIASMAVCGDCPVRRAGVLSKMGRQMIQSWHNRYFILDLGVIKYYERMADTGDECGETLKGKLNLAGAQIEWAGKSRVMIRASVQSDEKDLVIEAPDRPIAEVWYSDLCRHAKFATRNPIIVICDDI
jgi:hypothetical protein